MGQRGGCIGVRGWLRKSFNIRGLYDAQGFFAISIVVRFPRLGDPSEPSLAPHTAEPLAPPILQPCTRPSRGPRRSLPGASP